MATILHKSIDHRVCQVVLSKWTPHVLKQPPYVQLVQLCLNLHMKAIKC